MPESKTPDENDWPADVYFGDTEQPTPDWRKESSEDADDEAPPTEEERAAVRGILGFDPAELEEDDKGKGKGNNYPQVKDSPFRGRK